MSRRGRQVTFSSSAAYRANYQPPKRQLRLGRLWRPLLVLGLMFGFVYLVLFSPLFRVRSIAVRGNQQLTTEELKKQTQAILSASFLGNNSLFVSPDEVGKRLKADNYQLESIRVERRLLGGLLITVSEQRATLQWRSGSLVFVLSGNGKAYAQLDTLDKGLPVVEDSTNLPVKIGQKVVPSSFVAFVRDVDPALALLGLQATNKSVAETTTELYVTTSKGYVIKLDTTRSLESQMSDLKAVLAKKINPSEYVDLRIAGRVFYR